MTAYIEWKGVTKAFAGKPVLRGMNLAVTKGEVMFIIGTSGVGKSVTIKHLIGLLRIDAGEIWFDGQRVDTLPERAMVPIRKRIGMVFQSSTLFDSMTLAENVALPLRKHQRMSHNAALADAKVRLAQVYMAAYADRYPAELSDGMRKRAAIARTLALSPEVVLFDEADDRPRPRQRPPHRPPDSRARDPDRRHRDRVSHDSTLDLRRRDSRRVPLSGHRARGRDARELQASPDPIRAAVHHWTVQRPDGNARLLT